MMTEREVLTWERIGTANRELAAMVAADGFVPDVTDGHLLCHDLTAAIALVHPDVLVDAPTVPLAVNTGGSAAWGAIVADLRPEPEVLPEGFHPWRVALRIDADCARRALHELLG